MHMPINGILGQYVTFSVYPFVVDCCTVFIFCVRFVPIWTHGSDIKYEVKYFLKRQLFNLISKTDEILVNYSLQCE